VTSRLAGVVCAATVALVAACGGSGESDATLWVTQDRGGEVVLERAVSSGVTVMRALGAEADVETSYGGRFVESVEEIADDAGAKRSWFYFVNGIEADRGAAEYRVRPGDVVWWDYRNWGGASMRQPVVVGAFPEPFVHGYNGQVRPAAQAVALGLAHLIGAVSVEPISVAARPDANLLLVLDDGVPFSASLRNEGGSAGSPVVFRVSRKDGERLLADPELARHRYQGLP
jgi:hypothetical protein